MQYSTYKIYLGVVFLPLSFRFHILKIIITHKTVRNTMFLTHCTLDYDAINRMIQNKSLEVYKREEERGNLKK